MTAAGPADLAALPDAGRELLSRLRRGEPAAYEALVHAEAGKLLSLARRMLRDEEEARDVVQEAFALAFERLPGFKGECHVATWLYRITANAALMRLRSRRRRPETPIEELLPRFLEDGHRVIPPGDRELPGPEELAQRREARELVRRCIEELPDAYRSVLLLRELAELSIEEVAGMLGVTPNAVKVRAHRARQALRELLVARRLELLA